MPAEHESAEETIQVSSRSLLEKNSVIVYELRFIAIKYITDLNGSWGYIILLIIFFLPIFSNNVNGEWEMVSKLTETLELIRDENRQQSIQVNS